MMSLSVTFAKFKERQPDVLSSYTGKYSESETELNYQSLTSYCFSSHIKTNHLTKMMTDMIK